MLIIVCCLNKLSTLDLKYFNFKMQKKKILIQFGNRIRELRKLKGMSQEELADKASLHRTYIGMIERAEKNISIVNIEKISLALDIELNELFYNL